MSWNEKWNKLQSKYWENTISQNREPESFFWEDKKYTNYTDELTVELQKVLWSRWKVHLKILKRIKNKVNIDQQRKGLYQMVCLNYHCLANIIHTGEPLNEEILSSWKKLWEEIKKVADSIKPSSKDALSDNLDTDRFVETFREFSLSTLKSRHYLEAIEKIIKDKEVLTSKEEYLDKLLPYLFTDLDFIEQYFALAKENNKIKKEIYQWYYQKKVWKVDRKMIVDLHKIGYSIRHLEPLSYKALFSKATGKRDHNVYDYLEDIEIFQDLYTDIFEALIKDKTCNSLKKYLIFSELLHITKWIHKSFKQGAELYREATIKEYDDPFIRDLSKTLSQLNKHITELISFSTNIQSTTAKKNTLHYPYCNTV